ncbi:MAG: aspartate-semialdehyde dehydrogenase [Candidatus Bathyarchaeia archaeon]
MLKVAVLGATGIVGQKFIELLHNHPWFKVEAVAASERSVGVQYSRIVKWRQQTEIPEEVKDLEILPVDPKAISNVDIVYSALPSDEAGRIEEEFAREGFMVFSNASAHRMDKDVPILNPEVNCEHSKMVEEQKKSRGWSGCIVTNPNCTTAILTLSLKPIKEEFGIRRVIVSTMQALSGAGYPGVPSMDITDNVIPFIKNEEEKVRMETLKILGEPGKPAEFKISASCHRVNTIDGHLEAVFIETHKTAEPQRVAEVMATFQGEPQRLGLPTAPKNPIVVRYEEDRPQPRLDRTEGKGMSVVVGRIRRDPDLEGIKYLVLGHNTVRGAAGCSILNSEYFKAIGYI